MKINTTLKHAKGFLDQNAPVILTGIAVAGAGITAYFAAKGGYQAQEVLSKAAKDEDVDISSFTRTDKFMYTYKFYIPAVATLAGTSVCMVMATKIGLDRTAAMAGALVVAERANDQYKDKVKELFGENKATKVNDAIASDQVQNTPLPAQYEIVREGEQIFLDGWTGQYFRSTREEVGRTLNQFNSQLVNDGYMSMKEWYELIGLEVPAEAGDIGWIHEDLLDLIYTSAIKGKPGAETSVTVINFDRRPMPGFQSRRFGAAAAHGDDASV